MVVNMRRPVLFLLLAMLLAAVLLPGQEAEGPDTIRRRRSAILFFSIEAGADFAETERRLLQESLFSRMGAEPDTFSVSAPPETGTPFDEREMSTAALKAGKDSWIGVRLGGSREQPVFEVICYDLLTRKQVAQETFRSDREIRIRDMALRFWDPAAKLAVEALGTVEFGTLVTFRGNAGTRVSGLGEEIQRIGDDGLLRVTLPNPSTYFYRATKYGYLPVNGSFNLKDDPLDIDLGQTPAPRFSAEAHMLNLQFPGVRFAWYPGRREYYLRAGFTTYLLGIFLASDEETRDEYSFFYSEPLTELTFEAGLYLNPADALLRFYAGAGVALRIMHHSTYFGPEPIAPLVVLPVGGIEAAVNERLRAFLELAPAVYLSAEPSLLQASFPQGYSAENYLFTDFGAVQLINFRVGVRYQL